MSTPEVLPGAPWKLFMGICATWDWISRPAGNFVERFERGAFRRSIEAFKIGTLPIPVMFDHGVIPGWNDPLGRVILLGETNRGLETTFLLDDAPAQRVMDELGPGTWFLSLGFAFHACQFETRPPSGDGERPQLIVRDGLITELSIVSTPAAGATAFATALDRLHASAAQPIKVFK